MGPIIFSLGSINADLAFDDVGDLAAGGTIRAGGFAQRAGGKAANAAVAVHRLGAAVKLLGRVGDDHFGHVALEPLRKAGLPLEGVSVEKGEVSGVTAIALHGDGDKTILAAPNANEGWSDDAVEKLVRRIQDAPEGSMLIADFEISRSVLEAAFDACARKAFDIIVDPSFPEEIRRSDLQRFRAIAPNAQETASLTGAEVSDEADAREAARMLNDWGVGIACIKLPEGGCVMANGTELLTIPPPKVDAVDKTGAGDAFVAALAVALLQGLPAPEAARWGVAASSISVTRAGTQDSYPTLNELKRMLRQVEAA